MHALPQAVQKLPRQVLHLARLQGALHMLSLLLQSIMPPLQVCIPVVSLQLALHGCLHLDLQASPPIMPCLALKCFICCCCLLASHNAIRCVWYMRQILYPVYISEMQALVAKAVSAGFDQSVPCCVIASLDCLEDMLMQGEAGTWQHAPR